jgi:hypothetical protein
MTLGGLANLKDVGAGLEHRSAGRQEMTGAAPAALTGASIDRIPSGGGDASAQMFESCKLIVTVQHTMAVGVSVALQLDPEHAAPDYATDPTGATPGAFANVPASHQPSTASATQTINGTGAAAQETLAYDLRLVELHRHVRFNIPLPVFGGPAGAGDIVRIQEVAILGGPHKTPTRVETWQATYKTT